MAALGTDGVGAGLAFGEVGAFGAGLVEVAVGAWAERVFGERVNAGGGEVCGQAVKDAAGCRREDRVQKQNGRVTGNALRALG